ncbi:MAG: AsnC family transcriptional regulator [Desulfomonile sp.]|nr:AsnC family transcriptional regulator [Desulfomonile sp.]
MDQRDRDLLNEIQADFPVGPHPYRVLGQRLGMNEREVLERIAGLKQEGVIRRLGASINSRKVGFVSTLLAAQVPEKKLDEFVAIVNACPGVTHNYERDHRYNVWFTLISPSADDKERTIRSLVERTGIDILELPAKKIFKIRVNFKF